jgi:formamidopyrimidine-DNA glycosylase
MPGGGHRELAGRTIVGAKGGTMPELPEITCRARQMDNELTGRTIESIEVLQPKCLNVSVEEFRQGLMGAKVLSVTHRGKWLFVDTTRGHLLLNLGMGGETLLVRSDKLPEKWRVRLDLEGGETLAVNFWWFGYAHYVQPGRLANHKMTAVLGPNALDVSLSDLKELLAGRRGRIKSLLLDQSKIAGIGNAYVHDILFRAGLHPMRTIPTLSDEDIERLHGAIQTELQRSIDVGAASYETDLHGNPGGFTGEDLLVGYREGKPCPECGTTVEKIKIGSTSSFICPTCQAIVDQ